LLLLLSGSDFDGVNVIPQLFELHFKGNYFFFQLLAQSLLDNNPSAPAGAQLVVDEHLSPLYAELFLLDVLALVLPGVFQHVQEFLGVLLPRLKGQHLGRKVVLQVVFQLSQFKFFIRNVLQPV